MVSNLDTLAAELVKLAMDAPWRARLGHANRLHCNDHYSLEQMVCQYRRLYESASGLRGPA
jgi:hypothetical protein